MRAAPKPATAANDVLAGSASRIGRARVADQIIDELRTQIATGAYPRGSRLPTERELAAAFGVSAPTIREALRALSSAGLVEVRHGSGSYVASSYDGILNGSLGMLVQWADVGVEDLIGLLRALNLYAAELAVEHATEADIARVRTAAEATAQCTTLDQVTASITEFLVAFAAAAHQPLLDALCGFLVAMVVRLEVASYRPKSTRFWADWALETSVHRLEVAGALERRDGPALAEAVARFHSFLAPLVPPLIADRHRLVEMVAIRKDSVG